MLAPSVKLGEVVNLIGGGTPSKSNESFYDGDIPWATVRDMKQEQLFETELQISEEAVRRSSTNIIEAGNVITATRVGLGKVCVVQQDTAINQDLKALIPKDNRLEKRYLFWWLKSVAHRIEAAGTGATVKGVKIPFIKALEIPLPSIPEQKRIVTTLDQAFADIDKACALTEQNLKNAHELFDSYLQQVFSQRGEGWTEAELFDLVNFIDYRGKTPTKTESGLRLITAKNVRMGYLKDDPMEFVAPESYEGWMTRGIPRKGDVLFTTEAPLANVAQLDTDEMVVFAQRIITMQPDRARLDDSFLKYLLMSGPVQRRIHEKGTGATATGIKASLLKKIAIEFPDNLEEQSEIVERLDGLDVWVKSLEEIYNRKMEYLDELKKSLLQKAFTGELTNNKQDAAA